VTAGYSPLGVPVTTTPVFGHRPAGGRRHCNSGRESGVVAYWMADNGTRYAHFASTLALQPLASADWDEGAGHSYRWFCKHYCRPASRCLYVYNQEQDSPTSCVPAGRVEGPERRHRRRVPECDDAVDRTAATRTTEGAAKLEAREIRIHETFVNLAPTLPGITLRGALRHRSSADIERPLSADT
jgi:hypothetical protein